jgi:hypothetical protein
MRGLVIVSALVPALVAAAAHPAAANMAAPPRPSELEGMGQLGARTPLVVREADLVIDCAAGGPTCGLEVTYVVHNPGDAVAGGLAAFYALDTEDIAVTVDGQPAGRDISDPQWQRYDQAVQAERTQADPLWRHPLPGLTRHGLGLSVAPGARARVVVRGRLRLDERHGYGSFVVPASLTRHVLFSPKAPRRRSLALRYLVTPLRTWGAWPAEMTVTVKHPRAWAVTIQGVVGGEVTREGTASVRRGRLPTSTDLLLVDFAIPERPLRFVGGFAGIGGHVDDATGLVLRAGPELVLSESWMASVAFELELDDDTALTVVPMVMASSPWVLMFPALGVGLGVPVRLFSGVEVGGRFELDAHLGPLGMVMAIDYFPGMDPGPRRYQVTLLGQISL